MFIGRHSQPALNYFEMHALINPIAATAPALAGLQRIAGLPFIVAVALLFENSCC